MTRRQWTEAEVAHLVTHYPHQKTAGIAADLGRTVGQCYQKAAGLGLKKTAAFLASEAAMRIRAETHKGRTTQFKKGQTPWNSGVHYQAGGRSATTQFKKGQRSGKAQALWQPIGTERLSQEGYLERKIHDGQPLHKRWRAVHLIVWESAHGAIPKGHALVFRDGDKTHIALDNLELIPRAELMRRNSWHQLPPEVGLLVQLRGAITRQINKREKS